MAVATHVGGPADGAMVTMGALTQTRHYATPAARSVKDWVMLARYVFVPPRDGKICHYRYTGIDQVRGPVKGADETPEWS